jgi:zinc/manganese transport system ATP-binding protein
MGQALRVESLVVSLGGRAVLDGVSFELDPGDFAGLIGSNGAGKTTLLRAVLGLTKPTSGRIEIAGEVGAHRRVPIGYVPQRLELDKDMAMRASDLVGLGLDGARLGIAWPSRARRARIEEAIAAVGAESFANQRVGRLSGGQQQRVLIAHALVKQPDLLLLDEPLASLDLRAQAEVVSVVKRLADERQIAVLMSAHDMNPLISAMDRIVYLAGGQAASGSVEEIVTTDVLSRLYGHHVDVLRVHGRVLVAAGLGESSNDCRPEDPGCQDSGRA